MDYESDNSSSVATESQPSTTNEDSTASSWLRDASGEQKPAPQVAVNTKPTVARYRFAVDAIAAMNAAGSWEEYNGILKANSDWLSNARFSKAAEDAAMVVSHSVTSKRMSEMAALKEKQQSAQFIATKQYIESTAKNLATITDTNVLNDIIPQLAKEGWTPEIAARINAHASQAKSFKPDALTSDIETVRKARESGNPEAIALAEQGFNARYPSLTVKTEAANANRLKDQASKVYLEYTKADRAWKSAQTLAANTTDATEKEKAEAKAKSWKATTDRTYEQYQVLKNATTAPAPAAANAPAATNASPAFTPPKMQPVVNSADAQKRIDQYNEAVKNGADPAVAKQILDKALEGSGYRLKE